MSEKNVKLMELINEGNEVFESCQQIDGQKVLKKN